MHFAHFPMTILMKIRRLCDGSHSILLYIPAGNRTSECLYAYGVRELLYSRLGQLDNVID